MESNSSRLITGSAQIGTAALIIYIVGILRGAAVARLLDDTSLLGIVGIFNNFQSLTSAIGILGLSTAIARYVAVYRQKEDHEISEYISTGIGIVVIISVSISLIYFILASFLANVIYQEPSLYPLFSFGALSIIFVTTASFGIAVLQGYNEIKKISILNVIIAIMQFLFVSFFVWQYGLIGIAIGNLLASIIFAVVILITYRNIFHKYDITYIPKISLSIGRKMIQYSLPLFLSSFVLIPTLLIINSYIFIELGSSEAGLFKIGFNIRTLFLSLTAIFYIPLLPFLSELYSTDIKKLNSALTRILRLMLWIYIPITIILILTMRLGILILYGNTYKEATTLSILFVVNVFILSLTPFLTTYLLVRARTMAILSLDIIHAVSLIIFTILMVSYWGLNGSGVAFICGGIVLIVVEGMYIKKKFNIPLSTLTYPIVLSLFIFPLLLLSYLLLSDFDFLLIGFVLLLFTLIVEWLIIPEIDKNMIVNIIRRTGNKR